MPRSRKGRWGLWLAIAAVTFASLAWNAGLSDWRPSWPLGPPTGPAAGFTGPGPHSRAREEVRAEGRLVARPGAEVVIGSEIAGRILSLSVAERSPIAKGGLVAVLDGEEWEAAREEARSRVAESEAEMRFYGREVVRRDRLLARDAGTQLDVDNHRRLLETATARRAAAAAAVKRLDVLLSRTRITSPIAGTVIARHAQPGEIVAAGARIVTVVDLGRLRVEVEVDEFDVGEIDPGAVVRVLAHGFRGRAWEGTVEEIPDAVVGRRLRPEDPGQLTDTRVLLVKVAIADPAPLKLGQRVEAFVSTSGRGVAPGGRDARAFVRPPGQSRDLGAETSRQGAIPSSRSRALP